MQSQNWFERHLNATAAIAMLFAFSLAAIGSLEASEAVVCGVGALIYDFLDFDFDLNSLLFAILGLTVCLPILAWTMVKKAGKWVGLLPMLLVLVPFGWVGFLFFEKNEGVFGLRYWRGLRQSLCWIGVFAVVVLMVLAANYEVPVVGGYYDFLERESAPGVWVWEKIYDYSNAPLWVQIGREHALIPAILGVFLIYGALKK